HVLSCRSNLPNRLTRCPSWYSKCALQPFSNITQKMLAVPSSCQLQANGKLICKAARNRNSRMPSQIEPHDIWIPLCTHQAGFHTVDNDRCVRVLSMRQRWGGHGW